MFLCRKIFDEFLDLHGKEIGHKDVSKKTTRAITENDRRKKDEIWTLRLDRSDTERGWLNRKNQCRIVLGNTEGVDTEEDSRGATKREKS